MKKIVATCFSLISFGALLFAALYDRTHIDPVYGVFAFGLGWCFGGFWVLVIDKK